MKNPLIFISLALAIGVAIGVIIQNDPETPDSRMDTPTPTPDTVIVASNQNAAKNSDAVSLTELNRLLQKEVRARQALEQKLETLSRQMAELDSSMQSFRGINDSEKITADAKSESSGSDSHWFNEQALIDNGIASSRASELKANFEQLEMERLYLRDQSIRESWDREEYREAMQALAGKEDDLKNRLSESEYDAYLYASGRTNRVAVTNVLASSQAGTAGIQSGDYVIRYDNQRVYNGFDLQQATSSGSIGDSVALEVERDGETLHFYLPRGPLGIRMNSVSVAP